MGTGKIRDWKVIGRNREGNGERGSAQKNKDGVPARESRRRRGRGGRRESGRRRRGGGRRIRIETRECARRKVVFLFFNLDLRQEIECLVGRDGGRWEGGKIAIEGNGEKIQINTIIH